ncbi:hypothetical protein ACTVCO_03700 [Sanguibacter sp. A247]|uniref:hypothetical protein n=1 Tax=unclassified Sanguibacter TaxID=2645534 RepID=UPI003FD89DE4
MRWTHLFADLSAQLDADDREARDADVAELTRAYAAGSTLVDRIHAAIGTEVTLHVCVGDPVTGRVEDVAAEWVLLSVAGHQVVVRNETVDHVRGLGPGVSAPTAGVASRLSLGHVLRGLARDRAIVHVRTRHTSLVGRIDRVGADHIDLVAAPAWGERDRGDGPGLTVVPVGAIVLVADQAR